MNVMDDWQPIDTCPKDGSFFIAAQFLPGRPTPVFECEAYWMVFANPHGVYRREAQEREAPLPATHWKKSPTPPAQGE
jgi:hypothetical protein